MDFTSLDPNDCPYYLITRVGLSISGLFRKAFSQKGAEEIKPGYLGALMCLWKEEMLDETLGKLGSRAGYKLADLGRCAGLEPSTMTGLIDRMERDGLVCRIDDEKDRRVQNIHLTRRGEEIRMAVMTAVNDTLQQAFSGIEPERLQIVKGVLRQVLVNTNRGV